MYVYMHIQLKTIYIFVYWYVHMWQADCSAGGSVVICIIWHACLIPCRFITYASSVVLFDKHVYFHICISCWSSCDNLICIHMYIQIYVCICVYLCIYIHIWYIYTCVCKHIIVHIYMHTYIYIYTLICTYRSRSPAGGCIRSCFTWRPFYILYINILLESIWQLFTYCIFIYIYIYVHNTHVLAKDTARQAAGSAVVWFYIHT